MINCSLAIQTLKRFSFLRRLHQSCTLSSLLCSVRNLLYLIWFAFSLSLSLSLSLFLSLSRVFSLRHSYVIFPWFGILAILFTVTFPSLHEILYVYHRMEYKTKLMRLVWLRLRPKNSIIDNDHLMIYSEIRKFSCLIALSRW